MVSFPKVRLGVIDDARRRQRRRRLGLAAAGIAAAAGLVFTLNRPANDRARQPSSAARVVAPGKVFSESPYMGVTCRVPNSTSCDDVGLAVWLRRPAVGVEGRIAGRWFSLDDPGWSGPVHDHKRKMLAGFLRHAGLSRRFHLPRHWEGQPPRSPIVRVRIDYGRGAPVETRFRLTLSPGWG
jgi:hypothetical protein